jgi:CheR methyltransferase, all-alpha domain
MTPVDDGEGVASSTPDQSFRTLLEKRSVRYNFDFREYKEPSLVRRIRMAQVHTGDFETYSRYLDQHADEHVALFNTILMSCRRPTRSWPRSTRSWRAAPLS